MSEKLEETPTVNNPAETVAMLPCPFCGGEHIKMTSHKGYRARMSPTGEIWTMRCYNCGATFPNRYEKELLVSQWNKRTNSKQSAKQFKAELLKATTTMMHPHIEGVYAAWEKNL